MEEIKRTKRITIGSIAFIAIVIIGFVSLNKPTEIFKLTPREMSDDLFVVYQVTPEEAMEMINDSTAVFVDIRSIYEFEKSHLEYAINIPVPNLLEEESKKLFNKCLKDSIMVVLYGNNELEANAPWMLLYQLGYTNSRALMGGFTYYDKMYMEELEEDETYFVEDPAFDFATIIEEGSKNKPNSSVNQPKKDVVLRKKEKKEAEGGC